MRAGSTYVIRAVACVIGAAAVFTVGGCAEDPVTLCSPGVCPGGTTCEPFTGQCIPEAVAEAPVGTLGIFVSSAQTADGQVMVASYDSVFRALVLTETSSDGVAHVTRVDGGDDADVGLHAALSLDKQDQPHVAYYDRSNRDLKIASRSAAQWSVVTADSEGDVGRWVSIVVDDNSNAHVAYRDETNRELRILSMAPYGCRGANLDDTTFAPMSLGAEQMKLAGMPSANFGEFTGIAVSGDHKLVFSFYDRERGNLVLGRCDGEHFDLQIVDGEDPESGADTGNVGLWSSLAVDVNGDVGVAYFDQTRGVLKYAGSEQGKSQIVVVDDGGACGGAPGAYVGQRASLAMYQSGPLAPGLPRIAYVDATNQAVLLARRTAHGAWACEPIWPVDGGSGGALGTAEAPHGGVGLGLDLVVDADDKASVTLGQWSIGAAGLEVSVSQVESQP